jgi:hypothetical protein
VVDCPQEIIIAYVLSFVVAGGEAHDEFHQFGGFHAFDGLENHVDEFFFADGAGSRHIRALKTIVHVGLTAHDFRVDVFDGWKELWTLQENFISSGQSERGSWLLPVALGGGRQLRTLVSHHGAPEPMLPLSEYISIRLIFGKIDWTSATILTTALVYAPTRIIRTAGVDRLVAEVLAAEGADEFVTAEFGRVTVDEASPFVHFMPRFLIELLLIEVVFLFEFLTQLPYHVILEFK